MFTSLEKNDYGLKKYSNLEKLFTDSKNVRLLKNNVCRYRKIFTYSKNIHNFKNCIRFLNIHDFKKYHEIWKMFLSLKNVNGCDKNVCKFRKIQVNEKNVHKLGKNVPELKIGSRIAKIVLEFKKQS